MKKLLIIGLLLILSGCSLEGVFEDGDFFVYYTTEGGTKSVYLKYYNEEEATNITEDVDHDFLVTPVVSKDGKYVAYVSTTLEPYNLYLYDVENDTYEIIEESNGNTFMNVSFSYPSNDLVYIRGNIVYKYDIDANRTYTLYNASAFTNEMLLRAIYDDSDKIIYLNILINDSFEYIYQYDVSSRDVSVFLSNDANLMLNDYDGTNFLVTYYTQIEGGVNKIGVINKEEKSLALITSNNYNSENAKYIKDGEYIIFQSNKDEVYNIYVMTNRGTKVSKLTDETSNTLYPGGN